MIHHAPIDLCCSLTEVRVSIGAEYTFFPELCFQKLVESDNSFNPLDFCVIHARKRSTERKKSMTNISADRSIEKVGFRTNFCPKT